LTFTLLASTALLVGGMAAWLVDKPTLPMGSSAIITGALWLSTFVLFVWLLQLPYRAYVLYEHWYMCAVCCGSCIKICGIVSLCVYIGRGVHRAVIGCTNLYIRFKDYIQRIRQGDGDE